MSNENLVQYNVKLREKDVDKLNANVDKRLEVYSNMHNLLAEALEKLSKRINELEVMVKQNYSQACFEHQALCNTLDGMEADYHEFEHYVNTRLDNLEMQAEVDDEISDNDIELIEK